MSQNQCLMLIRIHSPSEVPAPGDGDCSPRADRTAWSRLTSTLTRDGHHDHVAIHRAGYSGRGRGGPEDERVTRQYSEPMPKTSARTSLAIPPCAKYNGSSQSLPRFQAELLRFSDCSH